MPAKKRITCKRTRYVETPQLMALAFNDAVRDILALDGAFHVGDERRGAVWQWNGVRWKELSMGDRLGGDGPRGAVERGAELAPAG
jgi:hypothetical protein